MMTDKEESIFEGLDNKYHVADGIPDIGLRMRSGIDIGKDPFEGMTMCVSDWSKHLGIPPSTLKKRLKIGIPIKRAFDKTPLSPEWITRKRTLAEILSQDNK